MAAHSQRNRYFSSIQNTDKNHAGFTYGWSEAAIITGSPNSPITGAWTPFSLTSDGKLLVDIGGSIDITGVTVNNSVLEGYAATGNMLAQSGNLFLEAISGYTRFLQTGSLATSSSDPVGVTGTSFDSPSGYATGYFLKVGGRGVEIASGFNPGYTSGANVELNFDRQNGALLVEQTDLNFNYDSVTAYPPRGSTVSNSAPSGAHPTGLAIVTGQIFAANTGRRAWSVTNMSTTSPLYILMGNGTTSTGNYNFVLNPASTANYAGGTYIDSPAVYLGAVRVSGAGRFISWEL